MSGLLTELNSKFPSVFVSPLNRIATCITHLNIIPLILRQWSFIPLPNPLRRIDFIFPLYEEIAFKFTNLKSRRGHLLSDVSEDN